MRPPLLTAEPINSVNMQEISDNLDKIEHSLLNRKEDQKQVSSSTFKSMNKSTKHQLSSITRTPANITSSSSTDPNIDQNDKNQLFNHDSFLSSIPERGDNDIETSINIFEINTLDGGDEMVFHSLYTSVLIEK
jgi:t-SNARE complex subunit (syntaxin)